jgi:hypothetical protein
MTMRELRGACLAAVLLATTASSAWAECAWVMWTTRYVMSGGKVVSESMLPTDAYTSKGECDRTRQRRETRDEERKRTDKSSERFYTCLPDTVDPRGPKAR